MSTRSTETGRRPEGLVGRKRDQDRTDAILAAASELLLERGYDSFGIRDIAERAGSGTGAIYRRWSTKEALMAEAMRNWPIAELPFTDDPVADLRTALAHKIDTTMAQPDLMPSIVSAARSNPEIAQAVQERSTNEHIRQAIARIIGGDHPHLEFLADIVPAVLLHRIAITKTPIDRDLIVDAVIALIEKTVST